MKNPEELIKDCGYFNFKLNPPKPGAMCIFVIIKDNIQKYKIGFFSPNLLRVVFDEEDDLYDGGSASNSVRGLIPHIEAYRYIEQLDIKAVNIKTIHE